MVLPLLWLIGAGVAAAAAAKVGSDIAKSGGGGGGEEGGSGYDNVVTGSKRTHDASDNSFSVTQQRFTGSRENHEHAFSRTTVNGNTGEVTHEEGTMNTIDGQHTT